MLLDEFNSIELSCSFTRIAIADRTNKIVPFLPVKWVLLPNRFFFTATKSDKRDYQIF